MSLRFNNCPRILVVGPAWAGDMVMAQSLFLTLQSRFPGCVIDVLAPAWTLPLLERMPEVSGKIPLSLGHGQFAFGARRRLGHDLRERYDWAIVLPNSWKSALVPFFAGIPRRTGYVGELRYGLLNDARRLDKAKLPRTVQRFVALGLDKDASLPPDFPPPRLWVEAENVAAAAERFGLKMVLPPLHPLHETARSRVVAPRLPPLQKGGGGDFPGGPALQSLQIPPTPPLRKGGTGLGVQNILALCPGAEYGPAKRWPSAYFADVARAKLTGGWQVWLFGSVKDAEAADAIERSAPGCVNLAGRTGLAEAVDLLSLADAVISNDSGLMHVAAALDKPLVAVYGSSDPGFTPPLNERARVVRLGLECSPCFQRDCPYGHTRCLIDIRPAQVLDELERLCAS